MLKVVKKKKYVKRVNDGIKKCKRDIKRQRGSNKGKYCDAESSAPPRCIQYVILKCTKLFQPSLMRSYLHKVCTKKTLAMVISIITVTDNATFWKIKRLNEMI